MLTLAFSQEAAAVQPWGAPAGGAVSHRVRKVSSLAFREGESVLEVRDPSSVMSQSWQRGGETRQEVMDVEAQIREISWVWNF